MLPLPPLLLAAALQAAPASQAQPRAAPAAPVAWRTLERPGQAPLRWALVLPPGFPGEAGRRWPLVLALPPGEQNEARVEQALALYWRDEARARGWIVASPAAPAGVPFQEAPEEVLADLLARLEAELPLEGRPHLAGVSTGGLAAFRAALAAPQRYASLLALPGFPGGAGDAERLGRLARTPVALFAGGDDPWVEPMERTRARLVELGAPQSSLLLFSGEGHVPASLKPRQLFERLEEFRAHEQRERAARAEVGAVLDALHAAAAAADGGRYFALFAPDAVYLGTDASERWDPEAFRAWAGPYFASGRGWTYRVLERHVQLAPERTVAWFDERLENDRYGETRGSGVLRKVGERWLLAQYNLAFPVPNELALELVERIRALRGGR